MSGAVVRYSPCHGKPCNAHHALRGARGAVRRFGADERPGAVVRGEQRVRGDKDEMVTIANSGHGELYLKEGEALYLVTSTNIPACQIGGKTFLLHGHTSSGEVLKDKITIEHPSSKAKDRAFYTVVKVLLKDVSFLGKGNYTILCDEGHVAYVAPQWQDNSSPCDGDADDASDIKYPICYVRNAKMVVSATLHVEPADIAIPLHLKGDGVRNMNIDKTRAIISGNIASISGIESENRFNNAIDFLNPLWINWFFSIDGGGTWLYAGKSDNQCYITLSSPKTEILHTTIDIGCRNAIGETLPDRVVPKIWKEFEDRVVPRISDGQILVYYRTPYNESCSFDVRGLLSSADGRCGAWARFFRDCIKVQGISGAVVKQIMPAHDGLQAHSLWVKNQDISKLTLAPPTLPTPLLGIPGQGSGDPSASVFLDHAIVQYGSFIYDPSYGYCFPNLTKWQQSSLDAVSFVIDGSIVFSVNSGDDWPLCVGFFLEEP